MEKEEDEDEDEGEGDRESQGEPRSFYATAFLLVSGLIVVVLSSLVLKWESAVYLPLPTASPKTSFKLRQFVKPNLPRNGQISLVLAKPRRYVRSEGDLEKSWS